MADNVWVAAGPGTNWSTPGNWSLGWAPKAGDAAIFDATSNINCTVDIVSTATPDSFFISSMYEGKFDLNGNTLNVGSGGVQVARGEVAHGHVFAGTINCAGDFEALNAGTDVNDYSSCSLNMISNSANFTQNGQNLDGLNLTVNPGAGKTTAFTDNLDIANGTFTVTSGRAVFAAGVTAIETGAVSVAAATGLSGSDAAWSCDGGWTMGDAAIITNLGTVTFTGAGNVSCGAATSFAAVVINNGANTITLTGTLNCTEFTLTTGGFDQGTQDINCSGDFTITAVGIGGCTLDHTVAMSGSGSTFDIATAGVVTCANLILWVDDGVIVNAAHGASRTISRLTCDNGATVTFPPNGARILTVTTVNAGDWSGTAGNVVKWRSSTPGTRYNLNAPGAGTTVSYMDIQDCNNAGGRITANDGTSTDSGNNAYGAVGGIRFDIGVSSVAGTYMGGGTLTIAGHSFLSTQATGVVNLVQGSTTYHPTSYVWHDTVLQIVLPTGVYGVFGLSIVNAYGETWDTGMHIGIIAPVPVSGGMTMPDYLSMTLPQLCRAVARLFFSAPSLSGKALLVTKGDTRVGQCVTMPNLRSQNPLVLAMLAQAEAMPSDTATETQMRGWLGRIIHWGPLDGYLNPATAFGNGGPRQFLRNDDYRLARVYHDMPV